MVNRHSITQAGFGVVELMISIVLGLLVAGITTSAFVQNKMTYLQNERFARMQESGRAALDLLARDLAMAGFWGNGTGDAPTPSGTIALSADCGTGWALNTTKSVEYFQAKSSSSVPGSTFPCLQDVSGKYEVKRGTNALAVRHAAGTCVSGEQTSSGADVCEDSASVNDSRNGHIYARSDGFFYLSDGAATTFPPVSPSPQRDWEYQVQLYYIGVDAKTGIPSLRRKTLTQNSGVPAIEEDRGGEFAEGVEYFHIEFGIDQTNPLGLAADGVPDCYLSDPAAGRCPGVASGLPPGNAISARIYVLVRSLESDAFLVPDNKTYQVGGVKVNDLLAGGGSFNDRFLRRVYSTTVQLRNPLYMSLYSNGLKELMK